MTYCLVQHSSWWENTAWLRMQPALSLPSPGLPCSYGCMLPCGQVRELLSLGHPEPKASDISVRLSIFKRYRQKTELETTQGLKHGQPAAEESSKTLPSRLKHDP